MMWVDGGGGCGCALVCCSLLQCDAVCCSVLQCVAVRCSVSSGHIADVCWSIVLVRVAACGAACVADV